MPKVKKPKPAKTWRDRISPRWRDTTGEPMSDARLLSGSPPVLTRAESLCPTESTILRFCIGEEEASEIIASWKPVFTVKTEVLND